MENEKKQSGIFTQAGPVARLIGHSLAASLGFAGLALTTLIPIGVVRLLVMNGFGQLAESLHWLEVALFIGDVALFSVVFLTGVIIFIVETIIYAYEEIKRLFKRK